MTLSILPHRLNFFFLIYIFIYIYILDTGSIDDGLAPPTEDQWKQMICEYHSNTIKEKREAGRVIHSNSYNGICLRWKQICKVSKTSLKNRIKDRVSPDAVIGRKPCLNDAGMLRLATRIENDQGSANGCMTIERAAAFIGAEATNSGTSFPELIPSNITTMRYVRKVPGIHTAQAIKTTEARMRASADVPSMTGFFHELQQLIDNIRTLKIMQNAGVILMNLVLI